MLWPGSWTCSSPWPQPPSPLRFCSHCSLHLGHSFSPLHLDNFPELSRLLLMLSVDFLGLRWPTCTSNKALGALWWLHLCLYSFHLWALVYCWPLPLHRKFSGDGSWAVYGHNHRPWRDDFCQCDVNSLLSFYISLYSNPCKAKKQLLIKQSIKLYVVIKLCQSTEHRMQTGSAEGLPPFHRHWSCLSLFFSGKIVQNKYITVLPLNSCLFLGCGSFIMARICHSCRIFKSCLLLSSKPSWEIVCIRYWAQQTTQI